MSVRTRRVVAAVAVAAGCMGAVPPMAAAAGEPPVTTAALDPAEPNQHGWFNQPVSIELSASDGDSGVDSTHFRVDGGSVQVYTGPVAVSAEGEHTLEYWSVDDDGNVESSKALPFKIDRTAPVSTLVLDPPQPTGLNGWYTTPVTLRVQGSDLLSGVLLNWLIVQPGDDPDDWYGIIDYPDAAGEPDSLQIPGSGTPSGGIYTIRHYSRDYAYNTEAEQATTVRIDLEAPTIAPPDPITAVADQPDGAIVTYAPTVTDNLDPDPGVSCTPPSGSRFPVGDTTVTCTAVDQAGRQAQALFNVTVLAPEPEMIEDSVDDADLPPGTHTSLTAKLDEAQAALDSGDMEGFCGAMTGFVNQVRAQSGKKIDADDADDLIAEAERLMAYHGC